MNRNTQVVIITFFVLIGLVFFIRYEREKKRDAQLSKKFILSNCRITDFGFEGGPVIHQAHFSFLTNKKKKVKGTLELNEFCRKPSYEEELNLKQINFPVIYSPSDPELNQILLKREEYKKYGLNYPDSLSQVLTKYFDCDN